MSDIPSSDRASILTELLVIQNNMLDGNIMPVSSMVDAAYNISDQGAVYIAEHGDNQQAILEQVFRGSYNVDDLHGVIANAVHYADNIDGDLNTTSILMLSRIEEIQRLTSEQPIDHSALFKEVATLGVVAQTSELMNSVSGMVASEDRNDSDIAQFNANMQAMSVIAMNIAQENGVDIPQVMEDVQQEMGVDSTAPSSPASSVSNLEEPDAPKATRSLRPTGSLSDEDRAQLLDKIADRYETNDNPSNSISKASASIDKASDSIAEANTAMFFSKLENWTRRLIIFADRDDRINIAPAVEAMLEERGNNNSDFEIAFGRNEKLIEGLWDSAKIEDVEKSFLGFKYTGKTDLGDELAEFSEYYTAANSYFDKHGTLEGAEEMFKYDSHDVLNAIENGNIAPPVAEGHNPTAMATSFKPPSPD